MKLSIVSTLYQSSAHLNEFYDRASASARQIAGDDYEIILVNDGSPDNSLDLAIDITEKDSHVIAVDLSRNFGHHKAMMTGLAHAQGDKVFLIDSDLEEEPEWLIQFDEEMSKEVCDVVYGVQRHRKGGWFERWSGKWFYRLFSALTGLDLTENLLTSRLMTSRYVSALLEHREREVFIAGLWQITGFDQRFMFVKKHNTSATSYTLTKKATMLVNSVTSFSNAPLVSIFYLGVVISSIAIAYILYLLMHWAAFEKPLSGWTSTIASIWLLGGMIISFIGVIGVYLSKVFIETKQRPYTIVRQIYGRKTD